MDQPGGGEDYPYVATDGRENSPAAGNPFRVHRGGSQQTGEGNLRNALREWYRFDSSTNFIGMRCAMDYQP
jgi:formylglycine-generating enzyme required for sulfatase activity